MFAAACSLLIFLSLGLTQPGVTSVYPRADQPQTYLDYGERLAAEATTSDQLELAAKILAMGVLVAEQQSDTQLASSCCIALSHMSEDPDQASDLWDLAMMLDPGRFLSWTQYRANDTLSIGAREAAECLRLIRNAEYEDASTRLNTSSVQRQLREAARQLGYEPDAVLARIRAVLATDRDDDCKGRVFITRVRDGESSKHLCTDHTHPIGTAPDAPTLRMMLSLELACLNAADQLRDWGGAVSMSLDQPLRAPSTKLLPGQYGIDPDRPNWDGRQWVKSP